MTAAPGAPGPLDAAALGVDRLTEGLVSMTHDGTVLHANAAAVRLSGYSLEDVLGRKLHDAIPVLRTTRFVEYLERAVATGEVTQYEDFSPVTDGWLRRRFYPGPDGVTFLMSDRSVGGIGTDEAAELKQLLVRSQAAEQRYRELLDGMAEGVVETTPAGDFVTMNQSFALMLGYASPDDLLARVPHVTDLYLTPTSRKAALAHVYEGRTEPIEVELRHASGTTLWVRARSSPKYATTGELVGIQAIVEDVTQERAADRFLQENEDRIAERERTLIAEAVHDEPLQLIVAGILRLDSLQTQLPPSARTPLTQVADLLAEAVEGLRHLITTINPPELSQGLGPALRVLAEGIFAGTPTRIELMGPPDVPLNIETKWQAYRILREALINARKHAAAHTVAITLQPTSGSVVLSVADDGHGGATADSDPGHLGMATMRARATSLHGTLQTTSPPGGGTEVQLTLPRETAPVGHGTES